MVFRVEIEGNSAEFDWEANRRASKKTAGCELTSTGLFHTPSWPVTGIWLLGSIRRRRTLLFLGAFSLFEAIPRSGASSWRL